MRSNQTGTFADSCNKPQPIYLMLSCSFFLTVLWNLAEPALVTWLH